MPQFNFNYLDNLGKNLTACVTIESVLAIYVQLIHS